MIWLFCAALTLPGHGRAPVAAPAARARLETADRGAYDRTVFRDQLSELDRDVARGLIGEKDAEAARNEISRRLIAAAGGPAAATRRAPAAWP